MRKRILQISILFFCFILSNHSIFAQGQGPHSSLLTPTGVWGVGVKYLNLQQNIAPSNQALVQNAEFNIDLFPIAVFHTFGVKNQQSQLAFMLNPSSANLALTSRVPGIPDNLSNEGLSDGMISFKMGLIGAPALNVAEFKQHKATFSLFHYVRLWFSGTYQQEAFVNLGSNRFTIEYGMPIAIPLTKNRAHRRNTTWLEFIPSVRFYTRNNSPIDFFKANAIDQKPRFALEGHVSHNVTNKFWVSANLGFQIGGETIRDEIENNNAVNLMGGALGVGYQILPFLSSTFDVGMRVFGGNSANSRMIRVGLVFSYVNLKKLQMKKKKAVVSQPRYFHGF
ncbi:MAG: transporter [Saprospiraceae bacterium]